MVYPARLVCPPGRTAAGDLPHRLRGIPAAVARAGGEFCTYVRDVLAPAINASLGIDVDPCDAFAFLVHYGSPGETEDGGRDVSVAMHLDEADVAVNVCLGGGFSGKVYERIHGTNAGLWWWSVPSI